jgi:carbon starvation protein
MGIPVSKPNYLLGFFGIATLVIEAWIVIEAVKAWPRAKGVLEIDVVSVTN